jgi:REP element-mobilizing transposase RayT
MPRRRDAFYSGGIYHIFNRGAHRLRIFYDHEDYLRLLSYVKTYAPRYEVAILAYCLLPNHYHFLLRQDGVTPISKFIGVIFNGYTQYFNLRREHKGTLFEGRFKHREVTTEPYLLNLIRYIHANPVLHGLIDDPGQWTFSNYLEWVGERDGTLMNRAFIAAYFDSPAAYRAFVLDYLQERELPQPLAEYLQTLDI